MKIYNEIIQGSDEWAQVRLGKLTASDFHILMGDSQAKETILYKKAAERITGVLSDGDKFSNIHTERGKQLEPGARQIYELDSGLIVTQVGFVELDEFVGCSPDGLVGEDGGVEFKCKDNHGHLKAVIRQWIDPEHKTQCQFNMYVTERKWWDYVLYNPNFPNPIWISRILRDEDYIKKIKDCIKDCNEKIENIIQKI